jgi:hypothetical protein
MMQKVEPESREIDERRTLQTLSGIFSVRREPVNLSDTATLLFRKAAPL